MNTKYTDVINEIAGARITEVMLARKVEAEETQVRYKARLENERRILAPWIEVFNDVRDNSDIDCHVVTVGHRPGDTYLELYKMEVEHRATNFHIVCYPGRVDAWVVLLEGRGLPGRPASEMNYHRITGDAIYHLGEQVPVLLNSLAEMLVRR